MGYEGNVRHCERVLCILVLDAYDSKNEADDPIFIIGKESTATEF